MKKLLNFLIISGFAAVAFGQSDVLYTHFMFNKLAYNPAYAGSKGAFDLSGIYRKQWVDLDGAPRTMNFNVHTPFAGGRNALGLSVTADEVGDVNTTGIDLYYAYHLKFSNNARLSLGLGGRLEQTNFDWTDARPLDLIDNVIPNVDETSYSPNFGAGAYYYAEKWFVGLSVPRLLKNTLYLNENKNGISQSGVRTYYLMGGAVTRIGRDIQLLPSLLLSYNPNAPVDVDLNANVRFFNAVWIGGSYRLGDSFDGLLGYEFKNGLRIGIAADYTLSALDKYTHGSFEAMLGYTFKCKNCNVDHLRFF
jgi:type IX secretion system PorP/SprF family membrane protein